MNLFGKRWMAAGIIMILSIQLSACSDMNNSAVVTIESPSWTEAFETARYQETTEPSVLSGAEYYDPSRTMAENVVILNWLLETKYQRCLSISDAKQYEAAGKPGWTLVVDGDKVGFDTASWKYDYEPDSEEGLYMQAVLTTFIFYYGDEMGDALWRLAGDLLDGGADENEYGFKHNGGQVVYKDTRAAIFGYPDGDETFDTIYIWMTPGVTGEYKDVID